MFRKIGLIVGALLAAAIIVPTEIYHVSTIPGINAWVVDQQRIVDEQGTAAPTIARLASRFSALPTEMLNPVSSAEAQGVPSMLIDQPTIRGHVSVAQRTRPSISGATITAGSTDYRGRMTVVTANTVTVTFGTAFAAAPWCDVTRSDGESTVAKAWTVSTTALTITAATIGAGTIMNWRCDGVMP